MERLTERIDNVPDGESGVWVKEHDYVSAAEKLAEYEDLEEQSRLIKLPCKVGDTVYYFEGGYYKNIKNWKIVPIKVTEFNIKVNRSGKLMPLAMIANGTRYPISSIGKTVFLTKSEAEAKLKELKGGENESSNS